LLQKNEKLFKVQTRNIQLEYNLSRQLHKNDQSYITSDEYKYVERKYRNQKKMIIGEGLVFIFFLTIGAIQLVNTFNKEVLLAKQQNNFLLSITHEFKTPLSSIKLSLQTLVRRLTLDEKFQKLITNSLDDVERLQTLVDKILLAARMENSSYAFQFEKHNISDLITGFIHKLQSMPGGARIESDIIESDLEYEVDKDALFSVVSNLIENALKYSDTDKKIYVSLFKDDGKIVFQVSDQGEGVPDNEKSNIFKKFYRIGNEETRTQQGTGLGLFIAKKIVEAHQGKLIVTDNQPKGSIFKVIFPL
jgi:signal transduction histidine kinase